MAPARKVKSLAIQIVSPPEGPTNIIEFLDESENEIAAIYVNAEGLQRLVIYESEHSVDISLDEFVSCINAIQPALRPVDADAMSEGRD